MHVCIAAELQDMLVGSQYMSLICCSVDGQLVSIAGHIWVGPMLEKQLETVQVSRPDCIIQNCVSIAGLGIHIPT